MLLKENILMYCQKSGAKNTKWLTQITRKLSKHLHKDFVVDDDVDDHHHHPLSRITRSMERAQARLSIVVSSAITPPYLHHITFVSRQK